MSKERKISVSRLINTTPDVLFDILANPARHAEIDGSDSVRGVMDSAPERLAMGTKFGMKMKIVVPYDMRSTVVEFEENRLIAWAHFGKHRWRYELEEVDGGTMVTETFDWSTSPAPFALIIETARYPTKHIANMEKTLERLEAVATASSGA